MPDALELAFDPFDQMLLTADGTVTSLLKACTGEPVTARTTRQAGPRHARATACHHGRLVAPAAGSSGAVGAPQSCARAACRSER